MIVTNTVDAVWGANMTQVKTLDGQAYAFIAVDQCSSELVGHYAYVSATPQ